MDLNNLTPQIALLIVAVLGLAAWCYQEWFQ